MKCPKCGKGMNPEWKRIRIGDGSSETAHFWGSIMLKAWTCPKGCLGKGRVMVAVE